MLNRRSSATKLAKLDELPGEQWVLKEAAHLHKPSGLQWVCLTLCSETVAALRHMLEAVGTERAQFYRPPDLRRGHAEAPACSTALRANMCRHACVPGYEAVRLCAGRHPQGRSVAQLCLHDLYGRG